MDPLLARLTDAQREAVTHFEGPLLIIAGPGSGKTRVITHRIAWLLKQGVPGHEILALTFTNKAADEMSARVQQLTDDPTVWTGTFHRFCARLLRKYAPFLGIQENYAIYDVEDSLKILKQVIHKLQIDTVIYPLEKIAKRISWAKNNLITASEYKSRCSDSIDTILQEVYPAYQQQLLRANAVDFDDLLLHVAVLLRENQEIRAALDRRYRFVLVDEYQDTNLAQYAIARAISIDYPNLAVTGDPDQSIYGWRGANLNNILEFERDYDNVHVVRLEQNYRSTKNILRVAAKLISYNVRRKEKALFTENSAGLPVRLRVYSTQKHEADDIAAQILAEIRTGRRRPRDFAIFYRVNALSRSIEFALREAGIPYQMVNGLEFFQRKEIKDVLAYLRLLNNPSDEVAFRRIVNTPARGIGNTTVERLAGYATQYGLTMLEAARRAKDIPSLGPRPIKLLGQFVALIDHLSKSILSPIEELIGLILNETGYRKQLSESGSEEDQERLANIEELLTVAREFDERHREETDRLEAFLEEVGLVNDTDMWQTDSDRVTLMTLHASKGLEFPVVFLVAVEEGILPHQRCREHPEQLEEERRLMFVGITRAKEELQISYVKQRDYRGQRGMVIPSSFLMELPREEMDVCSLVEEKSDNSVEDNEADCSEYLETITSKPSAAAGTDDVSTNNAKQQSKVNAGPFRLTTAAQMLAGSRPQPGFNIDSYCQGMLVLHSTFGIGEIIALSGSGNKRRAIVAFSKPVGHKKILLSDPELSPLKQS